MNNFIALVGDFVKLMREIGCFIEEKTHYLQSAGVMYC